MHNLARAVLELACQTTIYACERILEQLHASRPAIDDPLPDGYTGRMESDGPMLGWTFPPDDTADFTQAEKATMRGPGIAPIEPL